MNNLINLFCLIYGNIYMHPLTFDLGYIGVIYAKKCLITLAIF